MRYALQHPDRLLQDFFKRGKLLRVIFAKLKLTVVRGYTAESVERDIVRIDSVKHADGMYIMAESAPCVAHIDLVKEFLTCVAEGSVTDVVSERYRFYELKI